MYRTLTKEQVEGLRFELFSDLPNTAKIYYLLTNHSNNLLTGFEVIVDQWPKWTSIMLRPASEESVSDYFRNYHMCHTKSIKDFKFFLQRPGVVDWSQPVIFTGIPYDLVSIIQEKSRKEHGTVICIENRFMYAWTKKEPPEPANVPENLTLTTLKEEDAEMLQKHWKDFHTEESVLDYFRKVINNFESSAVVTSDGKVVAYISMQFNGSMASLFVDPEYHVHNLGVILLQDLTRKLIEKHQTAFGFIISKDTDFINSCQKIGFSWVPQGSMSWVHYKPNAIVIDNAFEKNLTLSKNECTKERKHVFFNAMPLSCNKCSGIPTEKSKAFCIS